MVWIIAKVGRVELHSDKAFGKVLEHRHICEGLIDLFGLFFGNTNSVIRSMLGDSGFIETLCFAIKGRAGQVPNNVWEVIHILIFFFSAVSPRKVNAIRAGSFQKSRYDQTISGFLEGT
jgi:hypothetical protein